MEVEGDIAKPEFMHTKSMVDYAPAEISAVEQYEALVGGCWIQVYFKTNIL